MERPIRHGTIREWGVLHCMYVFTCDAVKKLLLTIELSTIHYLLPINKPCSTCHTSPCIRRRPCCPNRWTKHLTEVQATCLGNFVPSLRCILQWPHRPAFTYRYRQDDHGCPEGSAGNHLCRYRVHLRWICVQPGSADRVGYTRLRYSFVRLVKYATLHGDSSAP